MKISLKKCLGGLLLTLNVVFLFSCALGVTELRLVDRTLLLDPKSPDLIYPHTIKKCKFVGGILKLCKSEREVKHYDLSDAKVRKELIDSGFSCQSKLRFKY
jgi:hypothetical protein